VEGVQGGKPIELDDVISMRTWIPEKLTSYSILKLLKITLILQNHFIFCGFFIAGIMPVKKQFYSFRFAFHVFTSLLLDLTMLRVCG